MPYSSNSELPSSVRDKYSDKCQRAFRHAFNSVHADTGDEGKAMAAGHAAAQRCEGANKAMDMIDGAIKGVNDFKIFTGLLKASKSPDGKMRLHGVASSTTKDLHGDVMLGSALEDMERSANNNLTIFLNHSYNVPEDVGGSVEHAKSFIREVDHEGNPNVDLNLDVIVNDANPRAVQTWEAIDRGTKLGLSIGATIPEGGARRNKDGTYVIEHVNLLETSIVGIPANPRSWVEYAVKSLKGKDPEYLQFGDIPVVTSNGTTTNVLWTTTEPEITDAACPSCGGSKGSPRDGCTDSFHQKDIEPEVTDATVTIIQIDTSDGNAADDGAPTSQEAETSSPEAEAGPIEETAEGDDAALGDTVTRTAFDGDVTKTLTETLDLLRQTTRDLVETRHALAEAEVAKVAAESARDAAKSERDRVLTETKQILDRIADSPLVRRTVFVDAQRAFRSKFEGIYSEDFLKMLENKDDE